MSEIRMPLHRVTLAAAAAGLSLALAACGSSGSGTPGSASGNSSSSGSAATVSLPSGAPADSSKSPITIGYINQESGTVSYPEGSNAFNAAIAYINNDLGGADGHPLKADICLVAATQADALACAQQMVNNPSVSVISVGVVEYGDAMVSAIEASGKPIVGFVPVDAAQDNATNAYSILGGAITNSEGQTAVATQILHAKRVAYIYSENPGAAQLAEVAKAALTKAGVASTLFAIPGSTTDMSGTMNAINAAKPDAIMFTLEPTQLIELYQAYKASGSTIPLITSPYGLTGSNVLDNLGGVSGLNNTYLVSFGPVALADGISKDGDIMRAALRKYGEQFSPGGWALLSFSEAMTVRDLIARAGGVATPATIETQIRAFKGPVFGGPAKISCPGTPSLRALCTNSSWIGHVVDGKVVQVGAGWLTPAS
jgi:branched-chain amino acid transport system substrate-binding protein